ncbi:MAG: hypothetical protein P8X66_04810 [Maritimibacter sp.]
MTPRVLKRSALFAGGSVAGIAVSAIASYGLISFFDAPTPSPRPAIQVEASAQTAPRPAPSPARHTALLTPLASVNVEPLPLVLASASIGDISAATSPAPAVLNHATPAVVTRPTPSAPVVPETAPVETAPVMVSFGAPEITPPARPEAPLIIADPEALVEEIVAALPARAHLSPPARPASDRALSPEDFAALAANDATARGDATLFAAPGDAAPEDTRIAAADVVASDAWPEIPGIRPRARPEMPAEVVQVATAAPAAPVTTTEPQTITPQTITPRRSFGNTCGTQLTRTMPRRRGGDTGSEFFAGLMNTHGGDRDQQVINELARGNMPDYLRHLVPVAFQGPDARGAQAQIVICVTPDYLALGSDRDFVRTPLGLPAAAQIAGLFDMTLPTPRMVDAIYAQADVHLSPKPMQAGPQMTSTNYLLQHNATIQAQLNGRGGLIAGQKKDVVMASRMASHPGRVAIYGWHRSGGSPIQPVSTVHQASYADYSHGIRLVSKTAYLNGKPVALDDLLASNRYAWLINSDGPMPAPVIRTASR